MSRPRPTLRSPHQCGERPTGMTPLCAPGAGQSAENIEKMLGKPEQGKPESGSADRLPHERDQHLGEQRSAPRSDMEQAARDIESGQLDTDLHNTPGAEYIMCERQAASRDNSDRQIVNRSTDDLAHRQDQTGDPPHNRDEYKG